MRAPCELLQFGIVPIEPMPHVPRTGRIGGRHRLEGCADQQRVHVFRSTVTVLAFLLSTPVVQAADMVSASEADFVAEEPPPVPVFSWSGPYLGLQVGYGFGRDRVVGPTGLTGLRSAIALSPDGAIGGGHVGYLLSARDLPAVNAIGRVGQLAVVGLEGDLEGTNIGDKGGADGSFAAVRSDVRGSIRARFGVAAQRVLFYGTGGVAFSDFETADSLPGGLASGNSQVRAGFTVGGGVEWALLNSLSLRAEYRYSDFGRFSDATTSGSADAVVHHETSQVLRTGFSYRLGGAAPTLGVLQ